MSYDFKTRDAFWQKRWEDDGIYQADDASKKETYYALVEFPYPSGDGLHVGHPRPYIGMDVIVRKRRHEGYNVLYPMGWDAFGLPTENYAIKTGIHPREVTKQNSDTFRRQIKALGTSFDWSREVNTTDPRYYKWTQWIFLQLYKEGLAYKAASLINWCPKDKTVLANEEVIDGNCERCGAATEKKEKEQWMLAITKYAERLDKDLDDVDYLPAIITQQRNWIGKSIGAEIAFPINGSNEHITVFTTRPDTLFGATYMVLAPEHALVESLKKKITNWREVAAYRKKALKTAEMVRTSDEREKTGVKLEGITAVNPANNEEIPIYIADYVIAHYGTGAIMAVPAHDDRDFAFAKKYNLPVRQVIAPEFTDPKNPPQEGKKEVFRNIAHVIVRKKDGSVLLLYWKGEAWGDHKPITYIVGGIEDGEDSVEAARREVLEETGYKNLELVTVQPLTARVRFFAAHKDENRVGMVTCIIFDLENEEKQEVSEKEKALHDVRFVTANKVHDEVNIPDDQFFYEQLLSPHAYTGEGVIVNSGKFDGMNSVDARAAITKAVKGKEQVTYKLRDWVFSRQRYWGEPIPMVHCEGCGWSPLPESALPLELPDVKNYEPTDTGESPLATLEDWVTTTCPTCKGPAKRETDTMPNWAGSSWYFLRYTDPHNDKELASKKSLKKYMPVDWYNGGMEHTTLHLLYSRFWHKFLYDQGVVKTSEPYMKRTSHGMILAEGGVKMSKSKGNVINPDSIIEKFGADTLRVYEMFMGPFSQAIAWNDNDIYGADRFLKKLYELVAGYAKTTMDGTDSNDTLVVLNQTIDKVSIDIETMSFNTALSQLMICVNELRKVDAAALSKASIEKVLIITAPFAPHITEELWELLGNSGSVHVQSWPEADSKYLVRDEIEIPVQVNGKVRAKLLIAPGLSEQEAAERAKADEKVKKWLEQGEIKKIVYIQDKILNIVVS